MTPRHRVHSNGLRSQDRVSRTKARLSARPVLLERRKCKLSSDTKITEFRHREPRLPCARKLMDETRLCRKFHNFPRDVVMLAHRVFLTHNELIHEPGCIGKKTRACTTCNSRIAKLFPGLAGIFAGKMCKNNSSTSTFGSHNSPVRTPIHAKFISLESRRRELSNDLPHDPF